MPIHPRGIYLAALLLSSFFTAAQPVSRGQALAPELPRATEKKPLLLALALTNDLESEEEKFRSIFTWVASNISYDWNRYYRARGSGKTDIKRMLRSKSGMCLDYTALMDTLCNLAGITNRTITGYARDFLFDVGDSIYTGNHAWNAVKLSGRWYLYDVTWASGEMEYRFTPLSRLALRLAKRYPERYKKKTIRSRPLIFIDECGDVEGAPQFYYKQYRLNRIIRKLIALIPVRVKPSYINRVDMRYYLVEPSAFALTHFPENPVWSLVDYSTVRDYENDSAFYYHYPGLPAGPPSTGHTCMSCDNELNLDEMAWLRNARARTLAFNARNCLSPANHEYGISAIFYRQSGDLEDSAAKINKIDTALLYLKMAGMGLRTAFRNADYEFGEQKAKNKRKQMLLLSENRSITDFIRGLFNKVNTGRRRIGALRNVSHVARRKTRRRLSGIEELSTVVVQKKTQPDEATLRELTRKHDAQTRLVDSLSLLVAAGKSKMDEMLRGLSAELTTKFYLQDSITGVIRKCTDLRWALMENYKRPVAELRKTILPLEISISKTLEESLFDPAEWAARAGVSLLEQMTLEYEAERKLYQMKMDLARYGTIGQEELSAYKEQWHTRTLDELCWLKRFTPLATSVYYGLENFGARLIGVIAVVVKENTVERHRATYAATELLWRKQRIRRVVVNNLRSVRRSSAEIKKAKRVYLNQLKKERRAAAKKS